MMEMSSLRSPPPRQKNRAVLQEKYGIDCGTHCTNAVVKLHEAKIEQEKYV
jgi:hypothetical protein